MHHGVAPELDTRRLLAHERGILRRDAIDSQHILIPEFRKRVERAGEVQASVPRTVAFTEEALVNQHRLCGRGWVGSTP
jgi:hypothetical protein